VVGPPSRSVNKKRLAGPVLAVATVIVWFVTAELPWPAQLFTTLLAVPLPALAVAQLRLLENLSPEQLPRLPIYLSTSVSLWLLALGAIVASAYSKFTAALIGLRPVSAASLAIWTLFVLASALLLYAVAQYRGWRESPILLQLIPRTARERFAFVILSLTAGICEELVFRGFLIAGLTVVFGSTPVAVVVASGLFGLLHAYQGPIGSARAGLLGLALAIPFVATGSLLPSMLAHTIVDIVGGLWVIEDDASAHALH
jgi:uncharacterized protein